MFACGICRFQHRIDELQGQVLVCHIRRTLRTPFHTLYQGTGVPCRSPLLLRCTAVRHWDVICFICLLCCPLPQVLLHSTPALPYPSHPRVLPPFQMNESASRKMLEQHNCVAEHHKYLLKEISLLESINAQVRICSGCWKDTPLQNQA